MKIDNVKVYDLEESIRASKYPMSVDVDICNNEITNTVKKLGSCDIGAAHDNWLNGVRVAFDLTFSEKAWTELQRYHFIDFVSSQSTMHRITQFNVKAQCNKYVDSRIIDILQNKITEYNWCVALKKKDPKFHPSEQEMKDKRLEILYNIPSGFELTARMTTNYRQLKTIYVQRRNHPLPDWQYFCDWVETLPHFMELCFNQKEESNNSN